MRFQIGLVDWYLVNVEIRLDHYLMGMGMGERLDLVERTGRLLRWKI